MSRLPFGHLCSMSSLESVYNAALYFHFRAAISCLGAIYERTGRMVRISRTNLQNCAGNLSSTLLEIFVDRAP